MLEVLFEDHLRAELIANSLNEFVHKVQGLEFDQASRCVTVSLEHIDKERRLAKHSCDDIRPNQLYVASTFLSTLRDYSLFWKQILNRNYVGSWDTLQDVQDGLRVVKRFCSNYHPPYFDLIEHQAISLEKLYPYRIFASIDAIVSDVKCSICGGDMNSFACPHIRGELYDGEMAHGIVGKIETLNSISLVEDAADKRCVIQLENTKENFWMVAYLSDLINQRRMSPWQFAGIRESTRKKKINEFKLVGRNAKCPCGSGKKFKYCCMKVGYVEVPHIDILFDEPEVPEFAVSSRVAGV